MFVNVWSEGNTSEKRVTGAAGDGRKYHHAALVSPTTMSTTTAAAIARVRTDGPAPDTDTATGVVNPSVSRNRTVPTSERRDARFFSRLRFNRSVSGAGQSAGS